MFAQDFRSEISFQLHEGKDLRTAYDNALDIAVQCRVEDLGNRVHAKALKEMGDDDKDKAWFDALTKRNQESLDGIGVPVLREALKRCDMDAFKRFTSKKAGVDEGVPT